MKRYDMEWDGIASTIMEPADDGEWVKYDEASKVVESLQNRLNIAMNLLEELGCDNKFYAERAQALIDQIEDKQ